MASIADMRKLASSMADMHEEFESLLEDAADLPRGDDTTYAMIEAVIKKLDISNAQESSERDGLAAIANRVGEAYGTYIKLLGISNRSVEAKESALALTVHKTLESLSDSFKDLVTLAGKINK